MIYAFSCMQQLANQSAAKSQKLKEIKDGLQLVVDKKRQLGEKIQEVALLRNKLDKIKLEHDQENQLLKKE